MSLQSLYGTTLIFKNQSGTVQGNAGGYAASTGAQSDEMTVDEHGNLVPKYDRAFRIVADLLTADGVVIVPMQTHVTEVGGKTYRVEKTSRRLADPCLHLDCKEI